MCNASMARSGRVSGSGSRVWGRRTDQHRGVVGWPGRVWEICLASRGGSRVRYGIEITSLADYADPRVAVHLARAAEVAGWEGLFMWDHLAFAWGVAFGVAVPRICVD
jgi:hypothetical protein